MSRFIFAMLLVPFAIPVTVLSQDETAPVETVKSKIPQALDPPAPKRPPKPGVNANTETSEPADQQIDLLGILRIVHAYGPPGYGADTKRDAKISYWALELPSEINMACTPDLPDLADVYLTTKDSG